MAQIKCSCGSTNCTLLQWNNTKEGAKTGGIGGAVVGALVGLAGGPVGAIAGAAIGAAGGALVGQEQPKDKMGRKIEKYMCNSCGKKFEVCPKCYKILHRHTTYSGNTTNVHCKNCNNFISSQTKEYVDPKARANAAKAYGQLVERNIDNIANDYMVNYYDDND